MSETAIAAKAAGKNASIMGVVTIVLGFLAMMAPMLTGFSVLMLVGSLMVAAGVLRMFWAFHAGSFGKGAVMFAIGGLTLLCGVALLANPLFASAGSCSASSCSSRA